MSLAALLQKNVFQNTSQTAFQTVVNYVRLRWAGWLFIGVLAFAATWSARIALQSKPFDLRVAKGPSLKHEPDFEATKLDAWRTNTDGTSRTHIVADHVVHYRDDLSSDYVNPRFSLQTPTARTDVSADAAKAYNDGERVLLNGKVQILRTATQAGAVQSSLESGSLSLYPDTGAAATREASVFKQGQRSVFAQGGFDYQDTEAQITLLGPVKVVSLPVKK